MSPPAWRRYLRFWGPNVEQDVDDELRFHLESRVRDYIAEGLPPARAREEAMRRFGDVPRVRDECRRIGHQGERLMRIGEMLSTVGQDVVFAVRQLARHRAFTVAAVLTLALGIGANAAIFSLVDAVVLHPLPGVREPERLVELGYGVSYPALQDFRRDAAAQLDLAAFSSRSLALSGGERPRPIAGAVVSGNYFAVLGARMALGRPILASDDREGAPPVAVISHAFWRQELGGDPAVLGRMLVVNGVPLPVVGVTEPGFQGTRLGGMDLWAPLHAWPQLAPTSFGTVRLDRRSWSWLVGVGRLRDGATREQATAAVNASAKRQKELHPGEGRSNWRMELYPTTLRAMGGAGVVRFATLLAAVVAAVLLLACANVANLLLARAAHRRREIAVRLALGASRGRLVRQLLTESLVLAALASALGVMVMPAAVRAVARYTTAGALSRTVVGADVGPRALAFTAAVAIVTAIVFGLVPALQSSRPGQTGALRDGAAGSGRQRSRLRDLLLASQVALCLVLLVGAGLFTRSLRNALRADLGFRGDRLALASVTPGLARMDAPAAAAFYVAATERVRALPGVRAVTWTSLVPMTDSYDTGSAEIEGYAKQPGEEIEIEYATVGLDYFATLDIPLLRGRAFGPEDAPGATPVAVINETMARRYWPKGDAVGRRLVMCCGDTLVVAGVARDAKYHALGEAPQPFLFLPLAQRPRNGLYEMTLVARTAGDPEAVLASLPAALRSVSSAVPVSGVGTYRDRFGDLLMPQRFGAALLGFFSALALVVAVVGVYGVVAYAVSQRSRELGIRVALGARPGSVVGLVLGHSLRDVAIGVVAGVALAIPATKAAAGLLYGVAPTDAVTFAGMSAMLLAVAALAALGPARRASKVDPAVVLRES